MNLKFSLLLLKRFLLGFILTKGAMIRRMDVNRNLMLFINGRPLPASSSISFSAIQIRDRISGRQIPLRIMARRVG